MTETQRMESTEKGLSGVPITATWPVDEILFSINSERLWKSKRLPSKKWKPIKTNSHMSNVAKQFCRRIAELEKSEITDYEKGEPNEKDIKAFSTTF